MRISQHDVERACLILVRHAEQIGINTRGWELNPGSVTNGHNFTITDARTSRTIATFGKTKESAWREMYAMSNAFSLATEAQRAKQEEYTP